jgi:hypothetical protein
MSLFYGQRDSLGQLNWIEARQQLKAQMEGDSVKEEVSSLSNMEMLISYASGDTTKKMISQKVTKKEKERRERNVKVYQKLYAAVDLESFGWINCDRFYDTPNKTNLLVKINKNDSIRSANIYLVFTDLNSIMSVSYFNYVNNEEKMGFENVPIGKMTRLIAYTIKDEKIFSYAADLKISNNQIHNIAMKETSDDELKMILNKHKTEGKKDKI